MTCVVQDSHLRVVRFVYRINPVPNQLVRVEKGGSHCRRVRGRIRSPVDPGRSVSFSDPRSDLGGKGGPGQVRGPSLSSELRPDDLSRYNFICLRRPGSRSRPGRPTSGERTTGRPVPRTRSEVSGRHKSSPHVRAWRGVCPLLLKTY